ncbi:UbiA-domain-containing protein [Sporormia fimetaria CBS 119925]|uniref:UbiA-domain-containing protein n=1 Tax=Sporormia fimetaria CBS 119925 TaxID=1340428 RepID=A0A6A6V163_9PLEO|nr:UbiA-domain-containing protein [Sporormia fimetaria CBS 119925]
MDGTSCHRISTSSKTLQKQISDLSEKSQQHDLSQQYGGRHSANWVDTLPKSWIPFIQLARLSPPVGLCLVIFPHVIGFLHGALLLKIETQSLNSDSSTRLPVKTLVPSVLGPYLSPRVAAPATPAILLAAGSFFLSNAGHAWNDVVDAPYDALVARTRQRPIVRGAVSRSAALLFTMSQVVALAATLWALLPNTALQIAWPGILANLYYPFAKRHTHFAQYVLGVCLNTGVLVGTASVLEAGGYGQGKSNWTDATATSTACLTAAMVLWTVIYDTIYAFQDREDDVKVGLKSTAVLFNTWTKTFLTVNLGVMVVLLAYVGRTLELGLMYYGFSVGGCTIPLGAMIACVDLSSPSNCWWWFKHAFWLTGSSIAVGLLV